MTTPTAASSDLRRPLNVHLLPGLFQPGDVAGGVVVVIDILRASSTIVTALSRGAAAVLPCLTVEEALSVRNSHPSGTVLLGGERGGVRIEGFDLGNSPREYTADKVRDRFVGFTTTNGTRALLRSLDASKIFVGSFLNLSRIVDVLRDSALPIHLVCAGTDGQITGEDVLFAGAVCQRLTGNDSAGESSFVLTDSAEIALSMWREQVGVEPNAANADHPTDESQRTLRALLQTRGGRNLRRLGYDADIAFCSQIDAIPVLVHRAAPTASGADQVELTIV